MYAVFPSAHWAGLAWPTFLQSYLLPCFYHSNPLESKANPFPPLDKTFSGFPFIHVQVRGHLPGPQSLNNLSSACIAKVVFIWVHCIECHVPGTLWSEWQVLPHLIFMSTYEMGTIIYTPVFTDEEIEVWGGKCHSSSHTTKPAHPAHVTLGPGLQPLSPPVPTAPHSYSAIMLHPNLTNSSQASSRAHAGASPDRPFPLASTSESTFVHLWTSLGPHRTLYLISLLTSLF